MGNGWLNGCGGGIIADKTWTTTADFDTFVKSESSGNREVITETDVVSGAVNAPAAGELQLENLFSDKFDVADADVLFRIKRDASDVLYLYYNLDGTADLSLDTGWTSALLYCMTPRGFK